MKKKLYKRVYIEITNVCNLNCKFCPKTIREKRYMRVDEFKLIINKIKDYTDYIYLHIKGEPLMHPNLEEIVDIIAKNNLQINITTNGRLLKDKLDIINSKKIRQINISLHSFNNINEIEDLLNIVDRINNSYISLRLQNDLDNTNTINLLNKHYNTKIDITKKNNKLKEKVFLSMDSEFSWPNLNLPVISTKGTCKALKEQIGVLVDGTVVSCCLDNNGDNNLGNIFNDDLNEIINSPKYQDMINGFKNNKLVSPLCQRCSYINRFK